MGKGFLWQPRTYFEPAYVSVSLFASQLKPLHRRPSAPLSSPICLKQRVGRGMSSTVHARRTAVCVCGGPVPFPAWCPMLHVRTDAPGRPAGRPGGTISRAVAVGRSVKLFYRTFVRCTRGLHNRIKCMKLNAFSNTFGRAESWPTALRRA